MWPAVWVPQIPKGIDILSQEPTGRIQVRTLRIETLHWVTQVVTAGSPGSSFDRDKRRKIRVKKMEEQQCGGEAWERDGYCLRSLLL